MAQNLNYGDRDNWGQILRKILMNLAGIANGTFSIVTSSSGGSLGVPTTQTDATVATAGTRVLAIAAGTKGMISAAVGNTGLLYVGDITVTNAAGTKKGIILSQAGMSPVLTGPIYIDADTNGDKAGVTTF